MAPRGRVVGGVDEFVRLVVDLSGEFAGRNVDDVNGQGVDRAGFRAGVVPGAVAVGDVVAPVGHGHRFPVGERGIRGSVGLRGNGLMCRRGCDTRDRLLPFRRERVDPGAHLFARAVATGQFCACRGPPCLLRLRMRQFSRCGSALRRSGGLAVRRCGNGLSRQQGERQSHQGRSENGSHNFPFANRQHGTGDH